METEESNKLIAEFMGVDIHEFVMNGGKKWEYHSSWDWLMPVVEKIYSSNEYVKYKDTMSGIFNEEPVRINSKYISVTHEAVVEFIKWYNEQKH